MGVPRGTLFKYVGMAEELRIAKGSKQDKYATLYEQILSVLENEPDHIARMANIAAMIHATFNHWWTGFYRVMDDELVLGPFQGPLACTRISFGKGVCGSAWHNASTIIVDDVEQFPGHIACSSLSRSEIVVPVFNQGVIAAVLDIDSCYLATFDHTDQEWLERIAALIHIKK